MIEQAVIVFLLIFIAVREYIIYQEMQKLVDKILSRDLTEYTACQVDLERVKNKEPKKIPDHMVRI